jgi:phosphoribosylanthranilate isomerase
VEIRVKICGLTRNADAREAQAAGARYGGVILAPGSPRSVAEDRVEEIFASTRLARCGVFVNEDPQRVLALAGRLHLDVVQLHGDEDPETVRSIRRNSGAEVWKAVRPRTAAEFASAVRAFAHIVDGLLLDGWSATARGGTGARFPWQEVAAVRDHLPAGVRLIVAGGLNPANVVNAVALLRPHVVDVSSGVESSPGIKDPASIHRFAGAARGAQSRQGVG